MRIDFVTELQKLKDTSVGLLFLYPILQLDARIDPLGVYMGFNSIETENLLVLLFHQNQQSVSEKQLKSLEEHNLFMVRYDEDGYVFMLFEFLKYDTFYKKIKEGKYSTVRYDYKLLITQNNNALAKMALYPDEHYEAIAEDLEVDIEVLIAGGELLPPPAEKDYLSLSKNLCKQITKDLIEI
jgi:hypothetical protein